MIEERLEGLLFDGRSAGGRPVHLAFASGSLRVLTEDGTLLHEEAVAQLRVTDASGSAARQISLPGEAVVEVPDGLALGTVLAAAGCRVGLVDRLEARWPLALAALVACVGVLALTYAYGLPAAARGIARALPASAERRLGDGVLEVLDGRYLRPTALTDDELNAAAARIAEAARLGAPGASYRLLFRSAGIGSSVNALALPGGTIVLLDGIVGRTGGDDRLVAVFGHELAHQARHHGTEAFLKSAGLGALASALWGDFSGQMAAIPATLAMFDYSRDAEREADEDALGFLQRAGRGALPMVGALCLLQSVEQAEGFGGFPKILSTHPKIAERIAHVRALGGLDPSNSGCPEAGAAPEATGAPEGRDETCATGEGDR